MIQVNAYIAAVCSTMDHMVVIPIPPVQTLPAISKSDLPFHRPSSSHLKDWHPEPIQLQ